MNIERAIGLVILVLLVIFLARLVV